LLILYWESRVSWTCWALSAELVFSLDRARLKPAIQCLEQMKY
jgi:hypothetical protein